MIITVEKKRLSLAYNWTISRNTSTYKDNVFVSIEKDGYTGLGEAAPNVRYGESADKTVFAIENAVAFLENSDLHDYKGISRHLKGIINDQNCAVCAIDIAVLDRLAKEKNQPLYKFFKIDPQDIPFTSYSIGIDSIVNMQERVELHADMPIFKIKLGTDRDREIITAIRQVTDNIIRVDANEGWKNKEKALGHIEWLAERGVEFVEQPMPSAMLEDMFWLKERSPLPLIADESVINNHDIHNLKDAFDGINIKLMKAGGITEALEMIKTARSLEMKIMLGCMIESSIAIAAAAHIAALVDFVDLDGSMLLAHDPYHGPVIEKGRIILNDSPGLGVSVVK